jgi:hypothetical protein
VAYLVRPGSALARTASELLQRHEGIGVEGAAVCSGCGAARTLPDRAARPPGAVHDPSAGPRAPPAAAHVPPMRKAADSVAAALVAAEA